ncbi:hypothetical protein ScPMuIL_010161 [Solemya velum]
MNAVLCLDEEQNDILPLPILLAQTWRSVTARGVNRETKSDKMVNIWLSFIILMSLSLGSDADCIIPGPPYGMESTARVGAPLSNGGTIKYTCGIGFTYISGNGVSTCYGSFMSTPSLICSLVDDRYTEKTPLADASGNAQAIMGFGLFLAVAAIVAHALTIL